MMSDSRHAGFTLLETLVAFLVLSIALAISGQAIAIGARSLSIAKERQEVIHLADVLQIQILPRVFDNSRGEEGENGGVRWNIRLMPVGLSQARQNNAAFAVITITPLSGRAYKFLFFNQDA